MPYSKIPTIVFSDWFNVESILEKIYQAVATRNEQVNLQPTLNKVGGGVSLTNFVTYCLKKKNWTGFSKVQKKSFEKVALKGDYIGMFIIWIWGFVVHLALNTLPIKNKKI